MLISLYPSICLTVASSFLFFFSFLLYQILECTTPKFFDQLQNKHEPQLLDSWWSSLGQPLYGIGSTLTTLKESDVDQTPCCAYHSWVLAICNYQIPSYVRPLWNSDGSDGSHIGHAGHASIAFCPHHRIDHYIQASSINEANNLHTKL